MMGTDRTLILYRDRVLRWATSAYGFAACYDGDAWQRFEPKLKEIAAVVPEAFFECLRRGLRAICLYHQSEQPEGKLASSNGMCFKDRTLDGCGTLCVVAISTEILEMNDTFVLVVLHELTHVLYDGPDHSKAYHDALDDLLRRYNERTGRHIENGYWGLTD